MRQGRLGLERSHSLRVSPAAVRRSRPPQTRILQRPVELAALIGKATHRYRTCPTYRDLGPSGTRPAVHLPVVWAPSTNVPIILFPEIFPTKNVFTGCPSGWLSAMVKARKSPSLWPKSLSSLSPFEFNVLAFSQSPSAPVYVSSNKLE